MKSVVIKNNGEEYARMIPYNDNIRKANIKKNSFSVKTTFGPFIVNSDNLYNIYVDDLGVNIEREIDLRMDAINSNLDLIQNKGLSEFYDRLKLLYIIYKKSNYKKKDELKKVLLEDTDILLERLEAKTL